MISIATVGIPPSLSRLAMRVVRKILRKERPYQSWIISIAALPPDAMRRINIRYRRKRHSADVLSFLLDAPTSTVSGKAEVLVCLTKIKRDAHALGVDWRSHFHHTLVHACLHLMGYHHDTHQARERMEKRERKYYG